MRDKNISINDTVSFVDKSSNDMPNSGMWARTEVIVGHGEIHDDGKNKAWMDEPVYTGHNTVVIGGVQYTMQKLFNISPDGPKSGIDIKSLHSEDSSDPDLSSRTQINIGATDSSPINIADNDAGIGFDTPAYNNSETSQTGNISFFEKIAPAYRPGHFVQLFGVGITGSGETDTTVYPVDYRDPSITMRKKLSEASSIKGVMYPFRYTTEDLNNSDVVKYFGKTDLQINEGINSQTVITGHAYYLKKFESAPQIKHIYSSDNPDVETEIDQNDPYAGNLMYASVESFVEMKLNISSKDLKEYFIAIDQANKARINTIALYSGEYVAPTADPMTSGDYGDFRDVYMFSKIIIPPEYLNLNKDINIIYRVYGS